MAVSFSVGVFFVSDYGTVGNASGVGKKQSGANRMDWKTLAYHLYASSANHLFYFGAYFMTDIVGMRIRYGDDKAA